MTDELYARFCRMLFALNGRECARRIGIGYKTAYRWGSRRPVRLSAVVVEKVEQEVARWEAEIVSPDTAAAGSS